MDRVPRPAAGRAAAVVPLLACLALAAQASAQDQRPRFQSGVDITSVDVSVVDDDGRPVQGLTPADFTVRISGAARRVVTADWVPLTATADSSGAAAAISETFSSNLNAAPGRIILIAIDQQNIRFGGAVPVRDALAAFVDRLQPSDRVGLMILGRGGQSVPFTADRTIVKAALGRVAGQKIVQSAFRHQIAMWEALAIHQDDNEVYRSVVMRECGPDAAASGGGRRSNASNLCPSEVDAQARSMAVNAIDDGERMLNALRASFEAMRRVEAPKSLVLVTEGFVLDPQRPSFIELERLAAAARTSVYALRLDQRMADASGSRAPGPGSAGMDRMALRQGLDFLASATRGQVFNVVMTPEAALKSIELDLSGYYLLGVESDPADRTDEGRDVSVTVNRPGVTVRSRRRLLVDDPATAAKDLAARALASPLVSAAVPIRVAALVFGGQERGKVQLAVRAEIGEDYSSPASMLVGYLLLGLDGNVVDSRGVDLELRPLTDGVPSPLQFATTISVNPGEYVLRVTATDGSRVGSAERKVAAHLHDTGSIKSSDLVAGGPVYTTVSLQPTVTSTVAFGNLHAYMEAYGAASASATVRFEVARAPSNPALIAVDAVVRPAGADRAIFTQVSSVRRLPPGRYLLRAIVNAAGCTRSPSPSSTCTLSSEFVIPSAVASPSDDVFLPVGELAGQFARLAASSVVDDQAAMWSKVDALLQSRQLGAARDLLEECQVKWPDEPQFARALALVYATFGRSADAVRMLQRYLAARPDDAESLALGVEWLYALRAAGRSVTSVAADLEQARAYAARHRQLNGPESELVQSWLDFMSSAP
jgi:VWFA-related protein